MAFYRADSTQMKRFDSCAASDDDASRPDLERFVPIGAIEHPEYVPALEPQGEPVWGRDVRAHNCPAEQSVELIRRPVRSVVLLVDPHPSGVQQIPITLDKD